MSDGSIQFPPGKRREAPKFVPPPWEREQFDTLASARRPDPEEESPKPEPPSEPREQGELDEERVALLLSGLRAEESRPTESYWKISMTAGIVLAIVGLAITTWGTMAVLTPKEAGAAGSLLVLGLLVPGLGFLGGGAWMIISSLRRQGVL